MLGVQLVFTGSITQFSVERRSIGFRGIGGSYSNAESRLDVRLINTETGEILMAAEGQGNIRMGGGYFSGVSAEQTFDQGAAQEALRPAVENVVAEVAARAGEFASLQPPMPVSQIVGEREGLFYINRGQSAGVTVGQQFAVSRVVDEIKDANGQVLDQVIDQVGRVEVTQVLSQVGDRQSDRGRGGGKRYRPVDHVTRRDEIRQGGVKCTVGLSSSRSHSLRSRPF